MIWARTLDWDLDLGQHWETFLARTASIWTIYSYLDPLLGTGIWDLATGLWIIEKLISQLTEQDKVAFDPARTVSLSLLTWILVKTNTKKTPQLIDDIKTV